MRNQFYQRSPLTALQFSAAADRQLARAKRFTRGEEMRLSMRRMHECLSRARVPA